MAQTPNLKLNLFNGSDKPNYTLFNDNNKKIDDVLNNARTHNHDGVNSSKIKATNVVFNNGDTTLQANNLEDAVKEVFIEADNKINWITNAIGRTSNDVSNPEIKVDEIKADFDIARKKYLENIKSYTLFNINGYPVNSNSSINDIAEAINNTTFKNATATKDDMLDTAHGITKKGIVEYGTIHPIEYLAAKPDTYSETRISKGMYKQLLLVPFSVKNPALHIKKGCNILGIQGLLSSHGSNGWDVGEDISKTKLNKINTDGAYFRKKGDGMAVYSSLKEPVTIPNSNSGGFITVQHFRLTSNTIECYTSDLKQFVSININFDYDITNSGSVQKNPTTTKTMFKVFKQKDALYAAIAYSQRVFILELLNKKVVYKYPVSISSSVSLDFNVSEIMVPDETNLDIYNIAFIGENGYLTCTPVYNTGGTAVDYWKGYKEHGLNLRYTSDTAGKVFIYPNEKSTREQTNTFPTEVVRANMKIEDGMITLTKDDEISINKYLLNHSNFELIYSIPIGGAQSTIQILDYDENVLETIQISHSATTVKTIYIRNSKSIYIRCISGKVRITGIKVRESGYADTRNKLFSQDWGYVNGIALLNTAKVDNAINEAYVLFGGYERNLDEGKCSAIYTTVKLDCKTSNSKRLLFGPKFIVDDMFAGRDDRAVDSSMIHRCVCFMSEHENYIFGTFPDKRFIYSEVSSAGIRYFRYNRRLIKLRFTKASYNIETRLEETTRAFVFKQFRAMFISHKGDVVGLEQSCTPEKFAYFTKLNNKLASTDAFEDWSEVEWRTPEEEFKILDDGNAFNKIKMVENIVRLYDTNGKISNTKIVGSVYTAFKDDARSTQASMTANRSDLAVLYTTEQGLLSLYNPIYQIIGLRD